MPVQLVDNIFTKLRALRDRHIKSPCPSVDCTRETVLFWMVLALAIGGSVAYIPSVYAAWINAIWDIVIIDTVFYGWLIALVALWRMPLKTRSLGLILPIWFLGAYLLFRFGTSGAGYLWLFVAPVLSSVLLGLRAGVYALIANGVFAAMLGWYQVNVLETHSASFWVLMSANFILLDTLITLSLAVMIHSLDDALNQMQTKTQELALTQEATIETVASLAEFRDAETGNHIARTQAYVRVLATDLSAHPEYSDYLSDRHIELLCKSAPLHDIGKVGVKDKILLKPGKLTEEEFEEMKLHTVYGRDALLRSEQKLGSNHFLRLAAEIAYSHQERWDGSGYPLGLKGNNIPLSGRIMAVADVYDALISRRVYKAPMPHAKAVSFLVENSNILFDPEIIKALQRHEKTFLEIAFRYAESEEEKRMLQVS